MQFDSAMSASAPRYRRVWLVLALSIVLIVMMSSFLFQSLTTLNEGSSWVSHTERVRFQLARIQQSLSDLGNGIAGYRLTHDATLFDAAESAARAIDAELDDLTTLVAADPEQQALLKRLTQLAQQRQRDTRAQRERVMKGDVAGVEAQIASGDSKRLMDSVRTVIGQMQSQEARQLELHRRAA